MRKPAIVLSIVMLCGCSDASIQRITGKVYEIHNGWQSFMFSGTVALSDGYAPLSGARIRLAFDAEGTQPIPGASTESDVAGNYTINLGTIPPPKEDGGYCIVVEKDGYQTYLRFLKTGPLSRDLNNTIVLVKQKPGKEVGP
jgi:hypothetical protein